jgi:hypothetical protein
MIEPEGTMITPPEGRTTCCGEPVPGTMVIVIPPSITIVVIWVMTVVPGGVVPPGGTMGGSMG